MTALIAVLLAAPLACGGDAAAPTAETPDVAAAASGVLAAAERVATAPVRLGSVSTVITASGSIEARRSTGVGAQVTHAGGVPTPTVITWQEFVVRLVPANLIEAMLNFNVLPLILFSLLFGAPRRRGAPSFDKRGQHRRRAA